MNDLSLSRQIGVKQNRAQSTKSSQQEFLAHNFIVNGRFLANGAGSFIREIHFPVVFTQEPLYYSGGVLEDNQSVTVTPECHAIVVGWIKEPQGSGFTYKGARIAVTTRGTESQRMWVNWHFIGTALVNPVAGNSTTEGTV